MSIEAVRATISEHLATAKALEGMAGDIEAFARCWWDSLAAGGTVFFLGNGGSAGDSQHLAAELSGRFERERPGLRGLALTVDTSVLTAVGNDYGFERVFARQVEALARPGDCVVCISTSGNSAAVLAAAAAAKSAGAVTLGLTGQGGGKLRPLCKRWIGAPSARTARIQEMHILIGHICCQLIDTWSDGVTNAR
ncbi:MAG: SIS domain-containing protein [Planctomycetota bacterium]